MPSSKDRLRDQIVNQLGDGILPVDQPFDIGYMKGTIKVCIHSQEDLTEVWRKIEKESCVLWCDGAAEVAKTPSKDKRTLYLYIHLTMMMNL